MKVSPIPAASPDKARFLCLDHIHMTEPYHRLMAKQWIKVILKQPVMAGNVYPTDDKVASLKSAAEY